MKIAVISFTEAGKKTAIRLARSLGGEYRCRLYMRERFIGENGQDPENIEIFPWEGDGSRWAGERFQDSDGIVFIGAAGIAVRMIAPWVRDKFKDPAVVVIDEKGQFSISLLSGHIGGGNRLAEEAARALGGRPVITTATDQNGCFAVDVFAKENALLITDRRAAKEISAWILEGRQAGIKSEFPLKGKLPGELYFAETKGQEEENCQEWQKGDPVIEITIKGEGREEESRERLLLRLIPRCVVLGIGCRKGVDPDTLWKELETFLKEEDIDRRSICRIASIDRKKEEGALMEAARRLEAEFVTFTKEELEQAPGRYEDSLFVKETVGIGNVCERAAVLGAGETKASGSFGRLLAGKKKGNGVTLAAAVRNVILYISSGDQRRKEWEES